MEKVRLANQVLPPGWLPLGVYRLSQGSLAVPAFCFAGLSALGCVGLGLGYRSTERYYTGRTRRGDRKGRVQTDAAVPVERQVEPLNAHTVPGLADSTAGAALTAFLQYFRHPQTKLQLIMPFVMSLVMGLVFAQGIREGVPGWVPHTVPLGAVAMMFYSLAALTCNLFGVDGDGFRCLLLFPVPRRTYLLARNLALLPLVVGPAVVLAVAAGVVLETPIAAIPLACCQMTYLHIVLSVVGNYQSILLPYRLRSDSMRRPKPSIWMVLSSLGMLLLLPVLMLPALACNLIGWAVRLWRGIPTWWLESACGILLVGMAAVLYRVTLDHAGRLLQRRERTILDILTRPSE